MVRFFDEGRKNNDIPNPSSKYTNEYVQSHSLILLNCCLPWFCGFHSEEGVHAHYQTFNFYSLDLMTSLTEDLEMKSKEHLKC